MDDRTQGEHFLQPGQEVRIIDGPFADWDGVIEAVDIENGRVRIVVSFFGRATPVQLPFSQVEPITDAHPGASPSP